MRRLPIALVVLSMAAPGTASAKDYSTTAYSVLTPGNGGTLPLGPNSLDQLPLYDGLTPLRGNVSMGDIRDLFKPNLFGTTGQRPTTRERTTNRKVRILVDKWGVPHITAKRRSDVMFGLGWMFAKERSLLLELARGPGRLTLMDPPGVNAFGLVQSVRTFTPSAQADAFAKRQVKWFTRRKAGRRVKQLRKDIDAYLRGINAQYKASGNAADPWNRVDFVAIAGFIGSIFGRGGGDEARRSMFLDALQADLGAETGLQVFNDLRTYKDDEASTSIDKRFDYGSTPDSFPGSRVLDNASFTQHKFSARRKMSNAQLTSRKRSKGRHPVFVAGPQLGYYYPEIVYEVDLHSNDGLDARGITSTGAGPYVFIGRGQDFSWSLTSANNDLVDTYVETLCDGSDTKYLYKGECRDMTSMDAGVLAGVGDGPDERLRWNETVHGPVEGYATVDGERVAIARRRSTRGREVRSLLAFQDLNMNRVRSAKDFLKVMPQLEHTFNAHYADSKDIAFISTGRLPNRPADTHPGLPVEGTGDHEWEGFLKGKEHPQDINPESGRILNWNNLPAPGWGAADDEWGYSRVHRNRLFLDPIEARKKHTPPTVVSVMNQAATQDPRIELLLPAVVDIMKGGTAPSPEAMGLLEVLEDWRSKGSSRIDSDLDGFVDHPGARIIVDWWPRLADAVLGGVLSPALLEQLDEFQGRGGRGGSAWVGWLDKDLRTLAGDEVKSKFDVRYCGGGDLAACQTALWASLQETYDTVSAVDGADYLVWRFSTADGERTTFAPGLIPNTMRYTNRPTFQQVMQFKGEAP